MRSSFALALEEVVVSLARIELDLLRSGGDPALLEDLGELRLRLVEIDVAVIGGSRSPEAATLEVASIAAESRRRFPADLARA